LCCIREKNLRRKALDTNWKLLNEIFPGWKKNPTLMELKSLQGFYLRTMNPIIYKVYSGVFTIACQVRCRMDRKLN
jgi:hypothetical protein